MRKTWKYLLTGVLAMIVLCCTLLTPDTAYAWKTKTHGYSANLLLKDASDGYVTVDGANYKMPDEYSKALKKYPAAYRAGVLGSDFYPDMLTGQSYIHPYDPDAGLGVGDWLKLLVDGVNSMPKDNDNRLEALAFTLGMATHYAGDMFGHDFINAFAGGAYPAYADAVQDEDKLFFIIRHMAEETYMDSQIKSRLGATDVAAPIQFILSNWIYNGSANSGPAKIYEKYGGMMYQYKYLVEMRDTLYKFAEKNRPSIIPPIPQVVAYVDAWIADLDTATYQLAKTFDDIAEDFLASVKDKNNKPKSDIDIVKDRLNAWLDNYGKYAMPTPDWLTKIADAFGKATDWVLDEIGLTALKDKWTEVKDMLVKQALVWGLMQAGIDYYKYENMLSDPHIALTAHGGSEADYNEYMTYMNAFKNNAEAFDAFYNTLVMGKLVLMGPENLNTFFKQYGVNSSFKNATGHIMMDEFDITIHTQKGNGTDNNIFVDVYENNKKITTKLLDKPGYNDFESNDTDTYRVELPHRVSPDKFHAVIRFQEVLAHTDSWTTDMILITCRNNGKNLALDPDYYPLSSMIVFNSVKTLTNTGDTIRLDLTANARASANLTYNTAVNLDIITFMWSNDNSSQWVNSKNILWNDMTARKNVLYEVFHGFKPKIAVSVDKTSFTTGLDATLTANFSSYWNGITKERRDREYLVSSVNETRQKACTGSVAIMNKVGGEYKPTGLTGTIKNGKVSVNLKKLEPGTYNLCVKYYGDEYNGSALSDPVTVTVKEPAPCEVTLRVVNGTWKDGSAADKTITARIGKKLTSADFPDGMKPNEGYLFGSWDPDPYFTVISGEGMVFTYIFKEIPEYHITFYLDGGTWADGTSDPIFSPGFKYGYVITESDLPTGMISERPGQSVGQWWPNLVGTAMIGDWDTTYSFSLGTETIFVSVSGGTWEDGSNDIRLMTVGYGQFPQNMPTGMIPDAGYLSTGSWDPDPATTRVWGPNMQDHETRERYGNLVRYVPSGTLFRYEFDRGCAVTYKIVGGTWADGSAEDITETVKQGEAPAGVPEGMKALPGWMGGSWDKNPAAVISDNTHEVTYTYTFDRGCLVTYKIEDGMWEDGSADDITATVPKGTTLTDVPTGMLPMPECRGGSWDTDPEGVTVTGDVTFTYTFESMRTYPVTYKIVNGTWADGTTADRTEYVRNKKSPSEVPEGMIANAENAAGSWNTDPIAAIITGETTFTWTFEPGCTVTYKVVNGTWADGTTGTKTENVVIGKAPADIPDGMIPASGYTGGSWDTDPNGATVTGATTYTWTFDSLTKHTVTYRIVNGTWADGKAGDRTETVEDGKIPAAVPEGMTAAAGFAGGAWDEDPSGAAITRDAVFTWTFDALPAYTVTYRIVNGTWADGTTADRTEDVTSGEVPAKVPTGMIAGSGFLYGFWDMDPEGSIITGYETFTYTFNEAPAWTVTYKVVNGTWADGKTEDKTENVINGNTPAKIPEGMIASKGYTGGAWDRDPAEEAITADATFTWTFDPLPKYTVTYKVVNGTWADGTTADRTEEVTSGEAPAKVPTGMIAGSGFQYGFWDMDPEGTAITDNETFTYTFNAVQACTVTYKVVNGTWADGTSAEKTENLISGQKPTKVPEGMIASKGYTGGAWDRDPAGKTITADTTFTWTFEPLPKCTVTYKVVNGTWADGTTADRTEEVTSGEYTAAVPTGMIAGSGFRYGFWDMNPTGAVITDNETFTYTFNAVPACTVTYRVIKGTWADGTRGNKTENVISGQKPTKVPEGMIAAKGYTGGAWDRDPAGETITADAVFTWTFEPEKNQSVSYTVTYDHSGWRKNSGTGMDFVVKRSEQDELTFQNYRKLVLDGVILGAGDADVSKGSLKVALKASKLQTLAVGTHTIRFVFSDGEAEADFDVKPEKGSFEDIAVPSETFTFTMTGDSGSDKRFDFTLYMSDGTVYSHSFGKEKLGNTKWQYAASFEKPIACYIIVKPESGYSVTYKNVGVYAGITDRGCDGGTITFKKIPQTGDQTPLLLWAGMILFGAAAAGTVLAAGRRRKEK